MVPLYYLMKRSYEDNIHNMIFKILRKIIKKIESNRVWMYMYEFVNCMILRVFIEFFGVKIAVILSKNHCDLIITVGFYLSQNSRYISNISDILPIYLK